VQSYNVCNMDGKKKQSCKIAFVTPFIRLGVLNRIRRNNTQNYQLIVQKHPLFLYGAISKN